MVQNGFQTDHQEVFLILITDDVRVPVEHYTETLAGYLSNIKAHAQIPMKGRRDDGLSCVFKVFKADPID